MKDFFSLIALNLVVIVLMPIMFLSCATPKKSEPVTLREQGEMIISESKPKIDNQLIVEHIKPTQVFFDFDKANLDKEDIATLNNILKLAEHGKGCKCPIKGYDAIDIEGHCDERGTVEYNLGLGQKRAENVAKYIKMFLPKIDIKTKSYGKEFASSNPKDYANDRRVDIYLK